MCPALFPEQTGATGDGGPSPVFAFLKNPSLVDFPGHLSAVFFMSGCNFSCGFCHNAELMGRQRPGIAWRKLRSACDAFRAMWVNGAVITGGEPTLYSQLPALVSFFKRMGWRVKLDTNGSMPDVLAECLAEVDYLAMDIKSGQSGYPELAGYRELSRIERSIDLIKTHAPMYEFRTTLIEAHHTPERIAEIGAWVRGAKRFALQPFVPAATLPLSQYREMKRTSYDYLKYAADCLRHDVDEVIIRGSYT